MIPQNAAARKSNLGHDSGTFYLEYEKKTAAFQQSTERLGIIIAIIGDRHPSPGTSSSKPRRLAEGNMSEKGTSHFVD